MLDELERAAGRFSRRKDRATLTVSVLPTIASVWLMPDGTYVISDDPNYNPEKEYGEGGKKMTR